MADLKKSIEIIFEGNDQASRKAADVIGKIREMEASGKAAATEADKLAAGLENVGGKKAVIDAAGTALKTLAAGLVFDRFVETNVAIEKFDRGLKAVLGTSVDTSKELAYVTSVADRLGIQLLTATDAYVSLTAATKGTALQGQATRDIFEAVSKAMAALGKSGFETEGALKAIEQISSKGKVSMEELRHQLGDRLPGALQIAARSMGVTTAELETLVKKGITAEEFLPKFAAELNKTFAGASFDGYVQSMARLRNAVDTAFVDIGKAGAFDALIAGVNALTATFTGSISAIRFFGETWANIAYTVSTGDFSGFGGRFSESLDKAASSTKSLLDALGLGEEAAKKVGDSGAKAGADTAAGMDAASKATAAAAKQTAEINKQLKDLGINPEKIKRPLDDLIATFEAMAANPAVRGDQILAGLKAVLKDVKDEDSLSRLMADIITANARGSLSAKEFAEATKLLEDAQGKLDGTLKKSKTSAEDQAKAVAKQAAETKKAEENAQKFRLEMEKLASNERIKNIEAKVSLNIAEVEAQTKRVEAAFESINTTVNSTGDLLGDLFGALKDYDKISFRAAGLIEDQIELENERRQEALNLQKKLIEAQVAQLRAQTTALTKGDSLIKVDGAGLQPHLEAFMFEILRTIQVRVNQDGLKLLLGV